jgi:type III secretion protein N (ATPase)
MSSFYESHIYQTSNFVEEHFQLIFNKCSFIFNEISNITPIDIESTLISVAGCTITTAADLKNVGDICLVTDSSSKTTINAEVVSINNNQAILLPFGSVANLSNNTVVKKISSSYEVNLGEFLLGAIVDGFGNILESCAEDCAISSKKLINCLAPDPLTRPIITKQLVTGVSAIDLFTSVGIGQRLAIFAAPGMGKTTLMGMILRNVEADIVVVGLIGERGREVREFLELEMNADARKKSVLVIATSDKSAVEQAKAPYVAQTIAEYFRDQGKNVVLFIDSITRYARAQREIGFSSGEIAVRGGYPTSVFQAFPKLIERAGNSTSGSITAFYTVLMENDTLSNDHIAEEIKSIVDGHIILSRKLAEQGHFPAINILSSLSRIANRIISNEHIMAIQKARMLIAKYDELELLIRVGEYQKGYDKVADEAINKRDAINLIIQQPVDTAIDFNNTLNRLITLMESRENC